MSAPPVVRFEIELVNGVGSGAYLDAVVRARISHQIPLTSGQSDHFQIDAATDEDADALRAERRWIKRSSELAGCYADVVITGPEVDP